MKEIVQQPGGRRYLGDDWLLMQNTYMALTEGFYKQFGSFILSGCEVKGDKLTEGIVLLDGKACLFAGCSYNNSEVYVKRVEKRENVSYKTGDDVGYISHVAEVCTNDDAGAFRLDTAKRFADVFKPSNAKQADNATAAANAARLDNLTTTDFTRAVKNVQFGKNSNDINTQQFVDLLTSLGAFKTSSWSARGTWDYSANQRVVGIPGGHSILLAGALVEVFNNSDRSYTIRVTTPSTGTGSTNSVFVYNYNGPDYSPSWFKLARTIDIPTSLPANGGNADTVDGKHASDFLSVKSNSTLSVYTPVGGAQKMNIGGLLISDSYLDESKVPANGTWIKGPGFVENGKRIATTDHRHGILWTDSHGVSTSIGSRNSSYVHFETTAPEGFHFDRKLSIRGDVYAGSAYNRRLAYADEITSKPLDNGTNLDYITTPGMYYCTYSFNAATMSNLPVKDAFSLLVEKHHGFKQTFTIYSHERPDTWIRNSYNGTWGLWYKVVLAETNGDIIAYR